jgi:hypothetical protein
MISPSQIDRAMRCVFSKGKQRELTLFAKTSLELTWRKMAHKLGIGYTTLRDWRDEKCSMQHNAFIKLVEMCPQCDTFRAFIVSMKEDSWGRKLGGLSTKQRKHGFLDPKYEKQSITWKSAGGQIGPRRWHVSMKKEKPQEYHQIQYNRIKQSLQYRHEYKGQKYRNLLELEVAKILTDNGVEFEYESLLRCGEKFYFPDFVFNEAVIECTFWHDAEQRAEKLRQKIDNYLKLNFKMILIVTTQKYIEKYSQLLTNQNVRVITPDNLTRVLGGKYGRVKRA